MFRNSLKMWLGGKSRKSSSGQYIFVLVRLSLAMFKADIIRYADLHCTTPILHTQDSLRTLLDLMNTFVLTTDFGFSPEQAAGA